ncbi:MAG: serine hydrolase [Oscillospiraceae bacterium]|nr:serine hydrolase [Oscillospiraceae bacterium]
MKMRIRFTALLTAVVLLCSLGAHAFAAETVSPASPAVAPALIDPAELQKMMDDFVAEYGLDKQSRSISVGFCYLKTGDTWYYNADKWYYSASMYKVPVAMLLAERELAGEISQDTYFENQYSSGTLETLERRSLVDSNNNTGHAMVEWMGGTYAGKCADQIIKYTDLPKSYFNQDFFDYSYYNVEFFTQVLKTLYNNADQYPHVLDFMKQAQPGAYLRTYLEGTYDVAQKYGAFEEVKAYPAKNNNHVGGIIYTPNPIALTIMSVNMENFNKRIGDLAKMFTDYALELDGKVDAYEAEQLRLQQEEAERLVREEQERLAREEEARKAAEAVVVSTPAPTAAPTQAPSAVIAAPSAPQTDKASGIGDTQKTILIAGLAVFIVGLALLLVILNGKRRRKAAAEPEDGFEADAVDSGDDEYLEPPEVRRNPHREPSYYHNEGYEDENYEEPQPPVRGAETQGEEPDEYLTDGDYLENDTFLDQSDYKDFQTDYGYGNYSAYDTEVYEEKPQEKTRFTGTGNHYKPKH